MEEFYIEVPSCSATKRKEVQRNSGSYLSGCKGAVAYSTYNDVPYPICPLQDRSQVPLMGP
jgi:hypothetical protein